MKRIKTKKEIKAMTHKELIAYKKEMMQYGRDVLEHIEVVFNMLQFLKIELKDRYEDLEYQAAKAQEFRENGDSTGSWLLDIH